DNELGDRIRAQQPPNPVDPQSGERIADRNPAHEARDDEARCPDGVAKDETAAIEPDDLEGQPRRAGQEKQDRQGKIAGHAGMVYRVAAEALLCGAYSSP